MKKFIPILALAVAAGVQAKPFTFWIYNGSENCTLDLESSSGSTNISAQKRIFWDEAGSIKFNLADGDTSTYRYAYSLNCPNKKNALSLALAFTANQDHMDVTYGYMLNDDSLAVAFKNDGLAILQDDIFVEDIEDLYDQIVDDDF